MYIQRFKTIKYLSQCKIVSFGIFNMCPNETHVSETLVLIINNINNNYILPCTTSGYVVFSLEGQKKCQNYININNVNEII